MDGSAGAVEAVGLGRRYGKVWGLRNATFMVKRGELVVLVGPNGAGKTTTIKILTTNLRPSKGRATVLGFDVMKEYREVRRKIAYMPQDFTIGWDHTPFEALTWNLVARGWPISDAKAQARRWLELVGLWECRDRPIRTLSGGQKRRATVAAVLATEADVMFLDEPTAGLDVEVRHKVWRAIRETLANGASILLTTHDMGEAETIGDRVVLIDKGITVAEGKPYELVRTLPYEYRIVVGKFEGLEGFANLIDLGDRAVIYAESYGEMVRLVEELGRVTVIHLVGRVGLEDAYLRLVSRGGGSGAIKADSRASLPRV
ncbi:MAG: ABC transporter ATP-binding protein [Thermoprotei archaeon]|nr:MAG: ABC transporter ATP-binding protein [Thermoprotei archaeon]